MNVWESSNTLDSERTVVAFVVITSGNLFIDRMVRLKTLPVAERLVCGLVQRPATLVGELRVMRILELADDRQDVARRERVCLGQFGPIHVRQERQN